MKYKAIIFDVGDTLLEHYPSQKLIYIERLRSLGVEVNDDIGNNISSAITNAANEQILKEQNGAPRMADSDFEAMLDVAALCCVSGDNIKSEHTDKLKQIPIPEQKLRIIPGAIEALQVFKIKGYRLGIVSNHRAWMLDYLKEIGLSHFFETIVVSDVVGVEKPDIRIMQIALNNLSLNADSCLYVGDHPFDVLCSKNAGMDCAWLAKPDDVLPEDVPHKEDYRVQHLNDLINCI